MKREVIEVEHHGGGASVPVLVEAGDDELARVASEAALGARLEQAIRFGAAAGAAAVVAVDCPALKRVASELGAAVGERALGQVARRLRRHSGPADLLARWGECGLALLLTGLEGPQTAEVVAGAVAHELAESVDVDLHRIRLGACVGLAWSPEHGRTAGAVVSAACEAARLAGDRGGDIYEVAAAAEPR